MDLIKKTLIKLNLYGEMVMFSHTLFSLPFALITLFLAARGFPKTSIIIYSIIALVGARTGANAFNRYADRFVDEENPRTNSRHIPQGLLKSYEALAVTIVSYALYFYAAYMINELSFYFSIVPIILFTIYPYTKRFTYLCHLFLGFSCALAVFGSWMAVKNELLFIIYEGDGVTYSLSKMSPVPIILFLAVMLWNAGFDIIYGTQDIEHDRTHNISSIPARFGFHTSLLIAKSFHLIMVVLLISLTLITPLDRVYLIGMVIVSIIFLFEHNIVRPNNTILMKLASYKLNQVISLTIFLFATLDIFFM